MLQIYYCPSCDDSFELSGAAPAKCDLCGATRKIMRMADSEVDFCIGAIKKLGFKKFADVVFKQVPIESFSQHQEIVLDVKTVVEIGFEIEKITP